MLADKTSGSWIRMRLGARGPYKFNTFDSSLDTSTALTFDSGLASWRRPWHLDSSLDTSAAASTSRQQPCTLSRRTHIKNQSARRSQHTHSIRHTHRSQHPGVSTRIGVSTHTPRMKKILYFDRLDPKYFVFWQAWSKSFRFDSLICQIFCILSNILLLLMILFLLRLYIFFNYSLGLGVLHRTLSLFSSKPTSSFCNRCSRLWRLRGRDITALEAIIIKGIEVDSSLSSLRGSGGSCALSSLCT
jgi:hypothetical protein